MSTTWINFTTALPKKQGADKDGYIEAMETNGNVRRAMWDWIHPHNEHAVEVWLASGFKAWRPA